MNPDSAEGYKSAAQAARRITEDWGAKNLYCVCCSSVTIEATKANSRALDFRCLSCRATYELKSGRRRNENRVPDSAYAAMMEALTSDNVPNLFVMHYSSSWSVRNLLLIPSFFFSPAAIEKRKPLGPGARRAGWVGCNILLSKIAPVGKIRLVTDGHIEPIDRIRSNYRRIKPLATVKPEARGWTLDVLNVVERLGLQTFDLADVYAHEAELAAAHPQNKNIRPKIRQQLQVLRDLGLLQFRERGNYRLIASAVGPQS